MKRIINKLILVLSVITLFQQSKLVNAISNTKVHLIFDKITYEQGEEIRLTINLENFANLNETRVVIKCNELVFKPIQKNNCYGQLNTNSIYEESLLNEYVSGGYLRFHLIKKNLDDGYYSGFKNNIGDFYFVAKQKITNIYDVFRTGNFESIASGINITLYDIYNREISKDEVYSEKIKINWNVTKYKAEVGTSIPKYLEDITIENRNQNEYEIVYNPQINIQDIGTKVINLVIFDKVNSDYIFLSKPIDIVDTTSPEISGTNQVEILSSEVSSLNENSFFTVTDNYDLLPRIKIAYYDENNLVINSKEELIDYLKHHQLAFILVKATDSSNNESDDFLITLNVADVKAPIINNITSYEVFDFDVDSFLFDNLIEMSDDYDLYPTLVYNAFVSNEEANLKDALMKGLNVKVKYYAFDKSNNRTTTFECIITVKDTTKPTISVLNDFTINDTEVPTLNIFDMIKITDNIDIAPVIKISYFINEEKLDLIEWKKALAKGMKASISYYGIDKSKNKTEDFTVNITVIDTSRPVIKIKNINEGAKYTRIKKIEYEVIDNFTNGLTYTVTLNDKQYLGEQLIEPGEYTLIIEAIDASGNKEEIKINFSIIKDNFIGCGDDIKCYMSNYLEIVIIICILMALILTILIVKLFKTHKKKKLR